jgi:hypothetical protein
MLFMTVTVLTTFVNATNAFGKKSIWYVKHWFKDLDIAEFKTFFSIVLYLGVIKYPSRKLAFEDSAFGSVFVRSLVSLNRFNMILRAMHFEDYTEHNADEIKGFKS